MKTTRAVCVSQYTTFDPTNPSATDADEFTLVSAGEDGTMPDSWVTQGYLQVGIAEVEIKLHGAEESTKNAVAMLKKQKDSVLAEARAKATEIERQIQTLLAITHEVKK